METITISAQISKIYFYFETLNTHIKIYAYVYKMPHGWILPELSASISLAKGPAGRGDVIGHHTAAITSDNFKRKGLSIKVVVALPVLAPIP